MSIAGKPIERYYDSHHAPEEEMGQNNFHFNTVKYLVGLLEWLYRGQQVYVGGELNIYRTPETGEIPITPDVVIIKGITPSEEREQELSSYYVGVDGPPPAVIIELSSPKTWRDDFDKKLPIYQEMGVAEYFIFDPHSTPLWTKERAKLGRLAGWRLNPSTHRLEELPREQVSPPQLWSAELESQLVIAGRKLFLYDLDGKLRLNQAEAEAERAEAERTERIRERVRADTEQAEKWREQARADTEHARAEAERVRAEKLAEFLRQHNFNPDDLA